MTRIYVRVLGSTKLEVDGTEVRLTPLTARLLARLAAARGEPVSAQQLYRDVWDTPTDSAHHRVRNRNEVQKRVLELRRAVDPTQSGFAAQVLRTRQIYSGREPESAYQLVLESDQLDSVEFTDKVNSAMRAASITAATLLSKALVFWHGTPYADVGKAEFSRAEVRRLIGLYDTARVELVQIYTEFGELDEALSLAQSIAEERPDDPDAARRVTEIRARIRARNGDEILRHEFPGLAVTLTVRRGDLFDQHEANIVAGFSDTFDTSTWDGIVISRGSVQGQLVDRIFAGDHTELDRVLRRGLRPLARVSRESVQDKPKGKRVRYPIGTVVPLPLGDRRIFAVAYSKQGNDLVSRSSPQLLRLSLDRLWVAVASFGMMKPVAIPLVGSGMARITELDRAALMVMIIDTFVRACRSLTAVTPELRIVVLPTEVEKIRLAEVARFIETLDQDGKAV